jgi:D-serine deaminase-like pyridoxal phosphate-dependent protein
MSRSRIEDLETPAAIVDLDILENNLRRLSSYAQRHALALRPHTKTHKIPELAKWQIASGCFGITVAKVGKAEVMTNAGLDNILVAYPVYGEAKLARLAAIARSSRILVAVDSEVTISAINSAASRTGSRIEDIGR